MSLKNSIVVYEYDYLYVGQEVNGVKYSGALHTKLAQYLTQNPRCGYYTLYFNKIRFCNYVGAIQVDGITIEVLPKTDREGASKESWQKVLIEMLHISMQVEAKTTTLANIEVREISVLETYLRLFLAESQKLLHTGLVKKYRAQSGNQNTMRGKLLISQHVTKNIVHAERFYVSYQIYDRDNIYNQIILEALKCIQTLGISLPTTQWCNQLMLDFPECSDIVVSEDMFSRLSYDRKTARYETAINLARIILLNYHPDVKGGSNSILAIMFDMNRLWENYIYVMLKKANNLRGDNVQINRQVRQPFWQHEDGWSIGLVPDIVIKKGNENIIIDTKWKFRKDASVEDVRQLYAYGKYFSAKRRYLLYPEKRDTGVVKSRYYNELNYGTGKRDISEDEHCDLLFEDILTPEYKLDYAIGGKILDHVFGTAHELG
jgi:5-methylcytosine-specific restriction enzyme subunit McrC